jgi:hypothetical protein
MSVSELVEIYFRKITKSTKQKSIIELVEGLKKPLIPSGMDLKKEFYEKQWKKNR